MKSPIFLLVPLVCSLIGCANRPESIRASYVPVERFANYDCSQLDNALATTQATLSETSRRQNDKANVDAFGVFLVGVPVSKLSGDHEGEIAQQKGQLEAIQAMHAKRNCGRGSDVIPSRQSTASAIGDAQERIEVLQSMKYRGLITIEEYENRRSRIIDEAVAAKPSDSEAASRTTINGEAPQFIIRDFEPRSGVILSENTLRLTASRTDRHEYNSGNLAISRANLGILRGNHPGPMLIGFTATQLIPGSTISARLTSTLGPGYDTPANVSGFVQPSTHGPQIIRVDITGYAPMEVTLGTTQSARGAQITGYLELDAATGLTLGGQLRSIHPGFILRREVSLSAL